MKHIYLLFIILSSASLAHSQCTADIRINSNGRGGYTFDTLSVNSPDAVATFLLTVGNDTLLLDTNTLQSSYNFDTNSTYRICMHLMDTVTLCESDTCKDFVVEDAEYHKLLEEVNEWSLANYICLVRREPTVITSRSSCSNSSNDYPARIFSQNDTIIDSLPYKIIITDGGYFGSQPCVFGYMREDTVLRRVYFRDDYDTTESLLYDFSLKVKDTISLRFKRSSLAYYPNGTYRVDSIKSFTIFSIQYRTFFLRNHNAPYSRTLVWLEGTGHLGNPVITYVRNDGSCGGGLCNEGPFYEISARDYGSEVLCFSHNQKVYFNDCSYQQAVLIWDNCFHFVDSCNYGSACGAIHEIGSLKSLDISPNPSDGKITLQFDVSESSEFEIILHALDGRTVSGNYNLGRLSAGLQSRSLNFAHLPAGLYLLECRNQEGSVFKKLVVN
ncbi:MAG: T9SS type A sorting domain-containing protein [Bacteroidetes bacterium]|nr:T9SS type A sorting domain-containing protein [Bacteroidota bacterium]